MPRAARSAARRTPPVMSRFLRSQAQLAVFVHRHGIERSTFHVQLQSLFESYKEQRAAGDTDPELLLRLRGQVFPELPALNKTSAESARWTFPLLFCAGAGWNLYKSLYRSLYKADVSCCISCCACAAKWSQACRRRRGQVPEVRCGEASWCCGASIVCVLVQNMQGSVCKWAESQAATTKREAAEDDSTHRHWLSCLNLHTSLFSCADELRRKLRTLEEKRLKLAELSAQLADLEARKRRLQVRFQTYLSMLLFT